MAKFDITALNYTTSGSKQNTFNIEYCYTNDGMIQSKKKPQAILSATPWTRTFFGDVGEEETMSQAYATNKAAFYDLSNNFIIHPLYSINKSKLRSTATKQGLKRENVDLYLPHVSSDLIGICQNGNYAYGLSRETQKQPMSLSVVFNGNTAVDSSYHYVLSNDNLQTYLYPTISDLNNLEEISSYDLYVKQVPELSDARISSIFSVARSLDGIGYNYLLEIPESTIDNKYDEGFIQCDMAVTKNCHNYLYNMHVSSNNYDLDNCREYCNIGFCGDLVYLTYRDNVQYKNYNKTITYYDNLDTEYNQLSTDIVEHTLHRDQPENSYSYQHVEVVHSFNRFDGSSSNVGHKSSLFSLTLHDTGLNTSTIPETVKEKLRQNISNNIRKIAEKICPANTQLFNVYFEGK